MPAPSAADAADAAALVPGPEAIGTSRGTAIHWYQQVVYQYMHLYICII